MKFLPLQHCLALLCLALSITMGCAPKPEGMSILKENTEDDHGVVMMDSNVKKIQVVNHSGTWTDDSRLRVQVVFRNTDKDKLYILQVQTHFRRADGNYLKDVTNWETFSISPNGTYIYEITAMDSKAEGFVTRVRLGGLK